MKRLTQLFTGAIIGLVIWRQGRRDFRKEFDLPAPTLQFPTIEQFQTFANFCDANGYDMEINSVSLCFVLSYRGQKRWLVPIESVCNAGDGPLPLYPLTQ